MSTRGAWGFRIDSVDKITYNHSDSYPDGLGEDLVKQIRALVATPEKSVARDVWEQKGKKGRAPTTARVAVQVDPLGVLKEDARKIKLVDAHTKPTDADRKRLAKYFDEQVNSGEGWYALLRKTQGDLVATAKAGIMIDKLFFMADSLFCEWAFVINLDDGLFEVYRGFQKSEHKNGRYASMPIDLVMFDANKAAAAADYFPVALVQAFPLTDIPKDWAEQVSLTDIPAEE